MDALSQILDDIHLRGAEYLYVMGHRDWHFELDTRGVSVFYIVLTGQMHIAIPDEPLQLLVAGDMAMVSGGKPHHAFSHEAARQNIAYPLIHDFNGHKNEPLKLQQGRNDTLILAIRCLMDVDMAKPLLAALPRLICIRGMTAQGAPDWLQIGLQFLALESVRTRPGRDTLINRLAGMMLIECVRDYVEQLPQGSDSWLAALCDPQLAPVLNAIHARPAASWTVAELASLACMSRSGFAERFSEVMGQPPLSYLSSHRLRLAAWNLREHQYSISRISELVGYSSETAFSQAFKRQYGTSPSQYRRQHHIVT